MVFSDIETLIMAYSPLHVTIIGIVTSFIKMISVRKANKKESNDQITELKGELQEVVNQNYALKKQLNELLTKIDHVDRGE